LARFCADRQYVANHAIAFLLKIDAKPSQRRQCAVNGGLMSYGTRSGCPRVAGSRPHLASVFQGKKEKQ
jgi:hypothetical protein